MTYIYYIHIFSFENAPMKCDLQYGGHFVQVPMCWYTVGFFSKDGTIWSKCIWKCQLENVDNFLSLNMLNNLIHLNNNHQNIIISIHYFIHAEEIWYIYIDCLGFLSYCNSLFTLNGKITISTFCYHAYLWTLNYSLHGILQSHTSRWSCEKCC